MRMPFRGPSGPLPRPLPGKNSVNSTRQSKIDGSLNAFARFGEGEPGKPRHHPARTEPRPPDASGPRIWEGDAPAQPRLPLPARTEPRPGVAQSWDCTTLAFLPISLRKFHGRVLLLSPPCEGGVGR